MINLQVNEYARFKNGRIAKITEIDFEESGNVYFDNAIYFIDGVPQYILKKDRVYLDFILKHSFNIIDLIECGDYVNGKRVIGVSNITGWVDTTEDVIYKDIIKSIVTKEQFAESEYKV